MEILEIGGMDKLFNAILNKNKKGDCWFRGQTNSNHLLCPQIFRTAILTDDFYYRPIKPRPMKDEIPDEMRGYKFRFCNPNLLIDEFKKELINGSKEELNDKSDLSVMCLGQHYGLPTELLDWTTDALVALYFSLAEKENNNDSSLFILKPQLFNIGGKIPKYEDLRDHLDNISDTVAFYGPRNNPRICRQSGNFTIHRDYSYYKLDLYRDTDKYLTKLIISHKLHKEISLFLKGMGINKESIYGEDDYKEEFTKKAKSIEKAQIEKIHKERMEIWENTPVIDRGIERRWIGAKISMV